MEKIEKLDKIITFSIVMSIISSFFIIKNLHIFKFNLPQLFYVFVFISFVLIIIRSIKSREYFNEAKKIINFYTPYILLFFIFIGINISFLFLKQKTLIPFYFVDLLRVMVELLLFIIIIIHISINKKLYKYIINSFFISLTISPILFFRDVDIIKNILPIDFFSNYSIQALQYNPTSLASWLIISFAISFSFLIKKIQEKETLMIIAFSIITIVNTSLIWWTNSRGALIGLIIIIIFITFNHLNKKRIITSIILILLISMSGFLILPNKAKVNVFARYFPQYKENLLKNNYNINTKEIHVIQNINNINFTNAQDRQNFWPKHISYVINHPFGVYGPIISDKLNNDKILMIGEHNTILQAGKWSGWVGISLILLFIYFIYKTSLLIIREYKDQYSIGIIGAYIGIFILSMLNSFINLKTFWIIPSILIATIYKSKISLKN